MDITIIVPISRERYLKQFFQSLEELECDINNINLLLYIDGHMNLYQKVQIYAGKSKFASKTILHFRNKGIPGDGNQKKRRQRIADIHNEIKEIVPTCDFVFLLEDDTLVPPNSLEELLDSYDKKTGISSGIAIGRHGFPIVGAWDKNGNDIESIEFDKDWGGRLRVSATGLYCCLVRREYYVEHTFKPFEKILGPDVNFGIWLEEEKGLRNYISNDIRCSHLLPKTALTFDNTKTMQVRFSRDESSPLKWTQEVISETEEGCGFC